MDPSLQVLIDLEDWRRMSGILDLIQRDFPTASISSGIRNWRRRDLDEAGGWDWKPTSTSWSWTTRGRTSGGLWNGDST
jgi:hypothetical protein